LNVEVENNQLPSLPRTALIVIIPSVVWRCDFLTNNNTTPTEIVLSFLGCWLGCGNNKLREKLCIHIEGAIQVTLDWTHYTVTKTPISNLAVQFQQVQGETADFGRHIIWMMAIPPQK
jgi:hypothetical protein